MRKRCTSDTTRLSASASDSSCTSLDWLTVSKKRSRSIDATHTLPASAWRLTARSASWADLPGRKPYESGWNPGSKMGTSCCATACWTMRSMAVGMPSSLTFPLSLLGISTRLTGLGRYLPLSILSVSASWLASSQAGSSATPMPSTPPAPPFLTTRSHAACMFSREQMRSSRYSVLPTCIASSSSSSVLHASVGASGYSRGSAPAIPGWPSKSIRSCLPSSARMVFLSDSLRLGSALRGRRRRYYGLC